jgi:hypothetical protein
MSGLRFADLANPAADSPIAAPRWAGGARATGLAAFACGCEKLSPVKIIEKEINRLFPPFTDRLQPRSRPLTNFSGVGAALGLCSKFPGSQRLSGVDGGTAEAVAADRPPPRWGADPGVLKGGSDGEIGHLRGLGAGFAGRG